MNALVRFFSLTSILLASGPIDGFAQEAMSLEDVAAGQQGAMELRLDQAEELLDRRQFGEAAQALSSILEAEPAPDVVDRATYLLGKALYRQELYHSALQYFTRILRGGPERKYFDAALEWCLFIGRKMVDDAAVSEALVQYGSSDFPEPYRDEFLFRLARHHFMQALADERAARLPAVARDDGDGVSFAGDLFGTAGEESAGGETDEGISIGEDIFGTAGASAAGEGGDGAEGGISIGGDVFGSGPTRPSPEGSLSSDSHLVQAERYALRVDPQSKYGARAKFIEALVLFERRRENDALDRFKDVVRLTRPGQPHPDDKLRELAFFQLARTHFGAQQPSFSTFYYAKVERNSRLWLDALFEDSWAQFRLGRYEKALGNLLTLHAPFFEESYFPESRILEAVIYYENCRYREAKSILARFLRRYEPILAEIQRITEKSSTTDDYLGVLDELKNDDLASASGEQAKILSQILELALADRDLERLDRSLQEVRTELERIDGAVLGASLASHLEQALTDELRELSQRAGRAVEQRLREEQENIKSLVQQAIRIDIETARSEQERIESRLRDVQSRPRDLRKTFVEWTDDEKIVWPFEGEYWRDELGTYELTLARSCR